MGGSRDKIHTLPQKTTHWWGGGMGAWREKGRFLFCTLSPRTSVRTIGAVLRLISKPGAFCLLAQLSSVCHPDFLVFLPDKK